MRENVFVFLLQNFVMLYVSNQNQFHFVGMPLLEMLELPMTVFGLAIALDCDCRGGVRQQSKLKQLKGKMLRYT